MSTQFDYPYITKKSLLFSPYITRDGLLNLKNYKYTSGLSGYIDQVIMTPWWNWCVELVPKTIAPNVITAISLVHAFIATLLISYYSPGIFGSGPRWIYLVSCICMFIYQTLDAIDGKQA